MYLKNCLKNQVTLPSIAEMCIWIFILIEDVKILEKFVKNYDIY